MVREQTLKSVLVIITKLSDRTINGDLLKQLAKTANDEQPGIRTNTTICLGKIAKNLGTSSRSKVLIAAFTRSLRDPFVHARNAALMSLGATAEHFTDEDCAAKIIPVVSPLLLDKEKIVRDSANRTVDTYLSKIRKAASEMPESVLPPPQAAGSAAASPRMGTAQTNESTGSGWTGWAISSFTNKLSAAAGDMQTQSANGSGNSTPARVASPNTDGTKKAPTASASTLHRKVIASPSTEQPPTTSPNLNAVAQDFFPESNEADDPGDSWGDMGDVNDDGFFEGSSSSNQKAAPVASATPFDDGEPDFAAWLAERSQKKPGTKPLPKGLSKTSSMAGSKKPAPKKPISKPVVAKKIDLKPKDNDDDDGWGDGW